MQGCFGGLPWLPGGGWALYLSGYNPLTLLAFMELLVQQGLSMSNIVNHMASIKAYFIIHGLDASSIGDNRLHLVQRSLKYTRKFAPKTNFIIDTDLLGDSPLYPFQAIQTMLLAIPGSSNDPLFQIPKAGAFVPLTIL